MLLPLVWLLCLAAMGVGLVGYVLFVACDRVISWGDDFARGEG